MPKDDAKPLPDPIEVEDLLAADDGPKPGILYLSKTDFGGVKMTDNQTFLGAGPDPNAPELPERARKRSPEDYAKVDAFMRAMDANANGRRVSTSVLEVFRAGYRHDAAPPARSAEEVTTSPGGRPRARMPWLRGPTRVLALVGLLALAGAGAFAVVRSFRGGVEPVRPNDRAAASPATAVSPVPSPPVALPAPRLSPSEAPTAAATTESPNASARGARDDAPHLHRSPSRSHAAAAIDGPAPSARHAEPAPPASAEHVVEHAPELAPF